MFEKVNPMHPDKIADRIAGALLDIAYSKEKNPKVAIEVLIGHGFCHIICESSVMFEIEEVRGVVDRIAREDLVVDLKQYRQDGILANNQNGNVRCGDNGIFKGVPTSSEQKIFTEVIKDFYDTFNTDGKFIISNHDIYICQSKAEYFEVVKKFTKLINEHNGFDFKLFINPLGEWTGGLNVDSGATNRKLGSDMGEAVTGGGLHGKDLSKADVSVNIYAHLKAQWTGKPVELCCKIGDEEVDGKPYSEIVDIARNYIERIGGFEQFAEWGLIR